MHRTLPAWLPAVGLVLMACAPPAPAAVPSGRPPATAARPAAESGGTVAADLVATARQGRVQVRRSPGGEVRRTLSHPNPQGGPLTFRVLERQDGWVRVQLPVRPNGASGWVDERDVALTRTPFRLVVHLSEHRLDVVERGRPVARHPVGVGTGDTPTPVGTTYLAELVRPPDPDGAYGPYAFGLAFHSATLRRFAGGPGQIGLHGTDRPQALGRDVSHGCLRVANDVITDLARRVPLGTPVEIRP